MRHPLNTASENSTPTHGFYVESSDSPTRSQPAYLAIWTKPAQFVLYLLVFKQYLPLQPLPSDNVDSTYNRLFFWQGDLIVASPYHDQDTSQDDVSQFENLGTRIASPFFTVDVARLVSGEWRVIEIGDGGVSTLPSGMDPRDLYAVLIGGSQRSDSWRS